MENNLSEELSRLERFRKLLKSKPGDISESAIRELEWEARRVIQIYGQKPKRVRPIHLAGKMRKLSKALNEAAKLIDEVEEQGMSLFVIASQSMQEEESSNYKEHIVYLDRMARLSKIASTLADSHSESQLDHRGGRPTDNNLRSLVVILMHLFKDRLSITVTRTINKETGLGESVSDIYIKEAIKSYAPEWEVDDYKIDSYIKWAFESREFDCSDTA